MAFNKSLIVAVAAVLVMCVGFSAAGLVRSTSSDDHDMERVNDFVVSETRDSASWTAFGRQWVVRLELSEVMEDNTDFYHGTLDGDASAVVSFSLLPGTQLSGMIITGADTWWIRRLPLPEHGHSMEEEHLGVFMHREQVADFGANPPTVFGEPLVPDSVHEEEHHQDEQHQDAAASESESDANDDSNRRRTVTTYKVAVYFDQNWALASNNPWVGQTNTMGLFNDVNAVYKAAGLHPFTFVYQKQITNPSLTKINDMLNYLSNTASRTNSAFNDKSYTDYLWLIGKNVGGLSYVGTGCRGASALQNQKTSVAGLVNFSRLWTVKTIAHELGHNRGAGHDFTNACTSTTTTASRCQCSVMSYCFPTSTNNPKGAVNFFSTYTIGQMHTAGCY